MSYRDPGLRAVLDEVGTIGELSRRLKISKQAVAQWKAVPVDRAQAIAKITGLPLHRIRPDVWRKERT